MAGDPRGSRRRLVLAGLLFGALTGTTPAHGQEGPSLFLVNDSTSVEGLEFEFQTEVPWQESTFRNAIGLRGQGRAARLKRALAWVPLIDAPDPIPFDPVALQRDVARLRILLQEGGYPDPSVDYRIRLDTVANTVDVTLTMDPGRPRTLEHVRLVVEDGPGDPVILDPPALGAILAEGWVGERLGEPEMQQLRERATAWARARGFAFAVAETRIREDADPYRANAEVVLRAGPIATVGGVRLENRSRLDSVTIMNHLLVRPGDTIRWRRLDESAKQLEQLNIVNAALVQVAPDQPANTAPELRVMVLEGKPRALSGRGGYADDRGVLTEARVEHRDFLGGGRTLRASAQAETGIWSFEEYPQELYGLTLSLTQPRVGSPRLDLIPSLSWTYEDGPREEARQISGDLTLVLRRGPNRFISLTGRVYERDVIQFRGLDTSAGDGIGLEDLIDQLLGSSFRTSLTLGASWGTRDDLANPNRGWVVSGSLGVTGPGGWSDVQYVRGDLNAAWLHEFLPGGPRLLARGRIGRLFPFGRSREDAEDPTVAWFGLGTATFTSGGVETVRGFATDLLGPKFFDLRREADSTLVAGESWIPLGGLVRWVGSAELQWPLGRGGNYGMLFADAGRVHTPDPFYQESVFLPLDLTDEAFYTVGAGMALRTPVGGLRFMIGYKLNPSALDLRDPRALAAEFLAEDGDPNSVPENTWRRFRFHLSLGQPF